MRDLNKIARSVGLLLAVKSMTVEELHASLGKTMNVDVDDLCTVLLSNDQFEPADHDVRGWQLWKLSEDVS